MLQNTDAYLKRHHAMVAVASAAIIGGGAVFVRPHDRRRMAIADEKSSELKTERPKPPATRASPRRGKRADDLSGVTRTYDDLHCQLIQSRHGVRVPAAATVLDVDGERLPIANPGALATSRAPIVFLPRGQHAVRFRGNESLIAVNIADNVLDDYWAMRDYFALTTTPHEEDLLARAARALDSHGAPMLLNLMGAVQAQKGQWAAAERKFRRSLHVNPCFSPAHLNLAHCLERRHELGEAARELRLAAIFNVGNVFGLAGPINELQTRLETSAVAVEPIEFDRNWYLSTESAALTDEDQRISALLVALSKYAQLHTERAKILNNLAVHFADSGRTEIALEHFRDALAVLKQAGPEKFALAREVLTHMSDACRAANLEEADEYERMRSLVSP